MSDLPLSNILVIKLGALGDFIQAMGPMAAIRKYHTDAKITLLTTKPYVELAEKCGYFDSIWIDEKPRWYNISGWLRLKKHLNSGGFERVYDLQNNDRTALYFKLFAGDRKPEWVGAAPGASHRNISPDRTKGHAFDGHVQTLKLAGIDDVTIDPMDWMEASLNAFPLRKPYVLLVPGSSPTRPEKRWPAEKYGELSSILNKLGFQTVLVGTGTERDIARDILQHCPRALDLTGQTNLEHIVVMARNAAAAIGNDTGPLHMMAATGCPVLALFSQHSDPVKHAPKGENVQILQPAELQDLDVEKVLKEFKPRQEPNQSASIH